MKPPPSKGRLHYVLTFCSAKVEVGDVMVEGDAFGAAELGHYVQDVALLAGREHALTVMDTIVGTLGPAQIVMHFFACC